MTASPSQTKTMDRAPTLQQLLVYDVHISSYPSPMTLIPSALVDASRRYRPSEGLSSEIESMWESRKPRQVGLVSEKLATEVISGGKLCRQSKCWPLRCESFKEFSSSRRLSLIPEFGYSF